MNRPLSLVSLALALTLTISAQQIQTKSAGIDVHPTTVLPVATGQDLDFSRLSLMSRASALVKRKVQTSGTTPMPFVAPLFLENSQFTSTMVMVNAGNTPASAWVILRSMRGTIITQRRVTVSGSNRLDLDVGEMLQSATTAETTGSITVVPDTHSLAAALSLTDRSEATASYLDEEFAMPMPNDSQMLRAVVENAKTSPIVAITSLAPTVQHVTISCLPEQGKRRTKVIELAAQATALTRSCSAADPSDAKFESLALSGDDIGGGALGIELQSDGPQGGFAAFGLAQHRSGDDQYFSTVPFEDPMMAKSSTTVFAGVPIGRASLLPTANYTPVLAFANFGDQPAKVTVTLATTSDGEPTSTIAATLQLPPRQSKLMKLENLTGNEQMLNSFIIKSDAAPGELAVKLAALGDGPLREMELLAKDEESGHNGGVHPWSIADGSLSTLLLFNDTSDAQNFHVSIGFGKGQSWKKTYTLRPMETASIGIADLIRSQIKDDHGNSLPSTLKEGDVLWTSGVNVGQGRLLQSDTANAMARSFSCYAWYFICGDSFSGPTAVTGGDSFSEDASNYSSCVDTDEVNECFPSYSTGADLTLYYSWTVGNTSILQLNSLYDENPANLTAIGGGQSNLSVDVSDGSCDWPMSETVTVTPKISSISPDTAMAGATGQQITIDGAGFGSSPNVNLPAGVTRTNQNSTDTQIVITVNILNSATIGNNAISVTAGGQNSNSSNFTVDGPYYLVVNSDIFQVNEDGFGNGERYINYQIKNFSGSSASGSIPIGETNGSDTGWNCTNHSAPSSHFKACGAGISDPDGTFTDGWAIGGATYTPTGCGFTNVTTTWNWCDGATFVHELVVINGYIHTNAVSEFGVVNPPTEIMTGTPEPH